MTDPVIDIDELERLEKEATAVPWQGGGGTIVGVAGGFSLQDIEFIKSYRNAAPELFRLARLAATQADEIAALRAELDEAVTWRCFHCDEVFSDRETASAHFGYSECSDPACRVDGGLAAAYRELEARWSRCTSECCEHANAYHAKEAERRAALVREEQRGYDKGVSDMSAELASARALLVTAGEAMAEVRAEMQNALDFARLVINAADGDRLYVEGNIAAKDLLAATKRLDAIAAEIAALRAERDEARFKLGVYADAKEISAMSWAGFNVYGDKKSIREIERIENRSSQLDVYMSAFENRKAALSADLASARALLVTAGEAMNSMAAVINAAGLLNLSNGVQLGPTVWYVKATEALEYLSGVAANIARATQTGETGE